MSTNETHETIGRKAQGYHALRVLCDARYCLSIGAIRALADDAADALQGMQIHAHDFKLIARTIEEFGAEPREHGLCARTVRYWAGKILADAVQVTVRKRPAVVHGGEHARRDDEALKARRAADQGKGTGGRADPESFGDAVRSIGDALADD